MKSRILPKSFYQNEDVLQIAQDLIGKFLVTKLNNQMTSGMIVETEAYHGVEDKASHAYKNRRTNRTKTMYFNGGIAYVYLCYGLHHLFNVVTAEQDVPHAVLIRAVEPVDGIPIMLKRRKITKIGSRLTAGPGMLCQALGITKELDGLTLTKPPIWIEDRGVLVRKKDIIASPRVGVDYAEDHRHHPWRFRLKNNAWTSPAS